MEDLRELNDEILYERMVALRNSIKEAPIGPDRLRESALGQEVRRRAKSDLFFLAKYFIGFQDKKNELMTEEHRRVCDLYVKKDDRREIAEQDWVKERMILYPRGTFKTTISVIDAVQWILNFPEIRILFLTATKGATGLAIPLMDGFKGHFVIRPEVASFMNLFFPEFCVEEKNLGSAYEFISPQRKFTYPEPTVKADSVESTMSGFHYHIIKGSDVVSIANSENEIQCKKAIKNFYINKKMLMPWGFLDLDGTRYADADLYGEKLEKNIGELKVEKGLCWEKIVNHTSRSAYLIGYAYRPKAGSEGKSILQLKADQIDLLFPEFHTYEFLRKEWQDSEETSESQYNQNPRPPSQVIFDRPLLLAHTVAPSKIPYTGSVAICWDFAYSKRTGRDYTTGVVGIYGANGSIFVVDIVRGRYNPTELAKVFVDLAAAWKYPFIIGVEKSGGAQYAEPAIVAEAERRGDKLLFDVCSKIDWFDVDTTKEAKKVRMSALHPWLTNDKLFFCNTLAQNGLLEILYREFEACLGAHHHDDIPDVIGQLPRYAPRVMRTMEKNDIKPLSLEQHLWGQIFDPSQQLYGYEEEKKVIQFVETGLPAQSLPGLEPMLGSGLTG